MPRRTPTPLSRGARPRFLSSAGAELLANVADFCGKARKLDRLAGEAQLVAVIEQSGGSLGYFTRHFGLRQRAPQLGLQDATRFEADGFLDRDEQRALGGAGA